MKTHLIIITAFTTLVVSGAMAQDGTTKPPAVVSATAAPGILVPAPALAPSGTAAPATAGPAQPAAAATIPASPTTLPADDAQPVAKNDIRMNFQGASLPDVLNYLSTAAGFVIIQDTPVTGTVNIISKQPLDADEAVAALNSVLISKGYVAIRDGRILKIVSKTGVAQRPEVQVIPGVDPGPIPKTDTIVTEIMQVKHVDATKLVENLRPLLSADASMSVNEGSNTILLTDTQAEIHRMAEIIQALDTSVSSISTIKVYPLRYADAKDFANVLTQLFSPDTANTNGQNQGGAGGFAARFFGGGGGGRGGGGGGGDEGGGGAAPESEARKAATRVVAVADTQSNSVVVSAPEEYITTIDEIVERLDTSTTDVTETRIFHLEHADSGAVSTILNTLYGDPTTTAGAGNNRNGQNNGRGGQQAGRGGNPFQPAQATTAQPSERELLQARMVAVADPRTNAVLVNCSHDTMEEVALTIGRLDATDAKTQHVHVIALQHADPDNVLAILRTLFNDTTATSGTTSALAQRQVNGASSDIIGTLTGGGNTGGTGGNTGGGR